MPMNALDRNRWISVGISVALVLLTWSSAGARTIALEWSHATPPPADGFEASWGTSSGSYTQSQDLGNPTPSGGIYTATIDVPDGDVYVVLNAYGAGGTSPDSNEKLYAAAGQPPPPPPPPGGAQAAVVGFALVDANDSSVIDSDLRNGDTIQLAGNDCLTIRIIGNNYLEQTTSPGSVMLSFDGQTPNACDAGGITHENEPPLNFLGTGCTAQLTQVGTHTLEVTPFDGDDCTGASGTASSVTFGVSAPGGGGNPPPEELGAPGQPFLVIN